MKNQNKINKKPYKKKSLLTEAEKKFFKMLEEAFPNYYVFPQVSMGAIVAVNSKENRLGYLNKFNQKKIDFIIVNNIFEVLAIVELDDSSHDKNNDKNRDEITNCAGYKTYRFYLKKCNVEKLRKEIDLKSSLSCKTYLN